MEPDPGMRGIAVRLLDALLPQPCLACGMPAACGVCAGCRGELPRAGAACRRCALPLPGPDGAGLCGRCLRHPPPPTSARVLLRYADPVDRWLGALKFSGQLAAGRLLSQLMIERLPDLLDGCAVDAVLPMPLHPARLSQRGYNQVLELLRPLRAALPAPIQPGWLQRSRNTAPQTGLDAAHRRRNLRGAFHAGAAVRGQRILLVDDVITTASTVNEAARCLLRAGAIEVHVLGWARAARSGADG